MVPDQNTPNRLPTSPADESERGRTAAASSENGASANNAGVSFTAKTDTAEWLYVSYHVRPIDCRSLPSQRERVSFSRGANGIALATYYAAAHC